ncbi:trafficking protein particle complex subunit partial [Plasmopara halstedii]|uniref:Trafficking protein particle complex subunit n=1 Tax=Plasmopara halstedii TaxID=4781 RepID=A0A0P1B6X7_PLAHL|nr:trafficking protein particle complex subunit partial [Plasmopara halstedii]CEG49549.1 trafficking protein particle complex subunit partial [Plasmopara halstedii]
MLHSLYIINKAGGLVYQQDLSPAAPKLSSNDHLRLASTFHSMHAIAALAAPTHSGGIDSLETSTFRLHCLQTPTGIKFFITAALGTADLDVALQTVYELYVDYVLKNPFYELEMPIRCSLFNNGLKTFVDKFNLDSIRRRPHTSSGTDVFY